MVTEVLASPIINRINLEPGHEFIPDPNVQLTTHFTLGRNDGVSLQDALLSRAMRELGITPFGVSQDNIPLIGYDHPRIRALQDRIFRPPHGEISPTEVHSIFNDMHQLANEIRLSLEAEMLNLQAGTVIIRNELSLPLNMAASLACKAVIENPQFTDVHFLLMHHDFQFEPSRADQYRSPSHELTEFISENFPPAFNRHPHIRHVVINSLRQKDLRDRGIEAAIIPDSYPFEEFPDYHRLDSAERVRALLDISPDDIVVGSMARDLPRKNHETAISFVKHLAQSRSLIEQIAHQSDGFGPHHRHFGPNNNLVLVMFQDVDFPRHEPYKEALIRLATDLGVDLRFADKYVSPGLYNPDGKLPFLEANHATDISVFPSIEEGFGNQLLEIIAMGKLPIVFEYPVFKTDIKHKIPHYISLGDEASLNNSAYRYPLRTIPDARLKQCVSQVLNLYSQPQLLEQFARENFQAASRHFNTKNIALQIRELLGYPLASN
jgi:glycosyltransferase involved in cell wall biosynthesis